MGGNGQKEVLIIIPAYNEEKNITKVLDKLEQPEIQEFSDVLVMNDASRDATNWIVKERKHTLVSHVFNLGYGSALQLGYKYAIRRNYKYVIQMDADGQHDVCNVKEIYKELKRKDESGKEPDIVLASRFMPGSSEYDTTMVKKFAYKLFRFMIRTVTGRRIADPTTGLQGLERKAVLYYSQYGHFDDKYPDANMIMQMLLLGFQIREIPAVMHPRTKGYSMHSGLKPVIYMFRMFFSILAIVFKIKVFKIETEEKVSHELYKKEETNPV
ncbi:MAG: glycosyltransferase family 2 protein [Lachnospiraceae bacterium]|nr:glycosyltransferase family 2 protein [Lachnospiraceae bacterium]